MKITVRAWDRVNLDDLGALTYAAKQDEMELGRDQAIEAIVDWLRERFAAQARLAVLAHSGSSLVGWLMLVVQNPTRIEINPWFLGGHPLVAPGQNPRVVGSGLLREAIAWAASEGFECTEFSVERHPDVTLAELEAETAWYRSLGFHIREEHVGLLYRVDEQDHASVAVPSGYELQPVGRVDQDALFCCYHDAFRAGQSHFFFDQSERERRAHFDTFGITYGLVEETSVALLHSGRIVGFTYVMPVTETHVHLDWMGVHPEHRRRGLGRFLLQFVVSGAAAQGVQTMSLSCDVGNGHALGLYRASGWREMEQGITYAAKTAASGSVP